eukprot:TRINITY_DN13474_c0_g1_i1.p2 TRINITY_DN13474_c0_g1~~TRINITY_DN13474_c0_g1_i1.p2  ORF type:complete len:102 (+),score=26.88 TRINITY_DN13474_c0_g1_i1:106-411(+)
MKEKEVEEKMHEITKQRKRIKQLEATESDYAKREKLLEKELRDKEQYLLKLKSDLATATKQAKNSSSKAPPTASQTTDPATSPVTTQVHQHVKIADVEERE